MRTAALVACGLVLAVGPAGATYPGANGKIVFERGNGVWTMDANGAAPTLLAPGFDPAWSPDGRRIAFVSGTGGVRGELAVMNADGGGRRLLDTDLGPSVSDPSWAPDGRSLVVSAFGDLYVVPLDGGRSRRLTSSSAEDLGPEWSPDGSLVAFVRDYYQLRVVHPDGSGERLVTTAGVGNVASPKLSWSPDGSLIAFTGAESGGVDVIAPDGTAHRTLLRPEFFTRTQPAWSPDGRYLVYLENADLCRATLATGAIARLTYTPSEGGAFPIDPDWEPVSGPVPDLPPAGPPRDFPRPLAWYPSCDHPVDGVALTAAGPTLVPVGEPFSYSFRLSEDGPDANSGIHLAAVSRGRAPILRAATTQGRCGGGGDRIECDAGTLFPGESARVDVTVLPAAAGTFSVTGYKGAQKESDAREATVKARALRCTVAGTSRRDTLVGTRRPDVVCGREGNDAIRVRGGGRDTVFCGSGRDSVDADRSDVVAADCERVSRR